LERPRSGENHDARSCDANWLRDKGTKVMKANVFRTLLPVCTVGMLALTSIGISATQAQTAPTVNIMVGGLNKIIYLPAKLTEQLGYFKDEGLNVVLSDEPAGVDATDQLLAGQVDGVVGFYDHTIDLQSLGKALEVVVQLDGVPGEFEMVSTKMADTIKSDKDFKGHVFGVTGIGSSTDFLTRYLAVQGGVSPTDITRIGVGAGDTLIAAMEQGKIDAAMTTEPTVSRLLKKGDAVILYNMSEPDSTNQVLGGPYPAASLYMQTDYVTAHPDNVQKLANALVKTLRWIHTHTAEEIAAQMPADYYAGDPALYTGALQRSLLLFTPDGVMPADGPANVLKVQTAFNDHLAGKTIDLSKTFTTDFVDKANAALGPMPTMAATMSMSSTMAPTMAAAASSTVNLAKNDALGSFLAGPNGNTLYTFKKDTANSGKSACSGGCAGAWPALTVAAGTTPTAGTGVTGTLATITRDDGSLQVTYNGLPLYYFKNDAAPGDTKGQGVGGVWAVAAP